MKSPFTSRAGAPDAPTTAPTMLLQPTPNCPCATCGALAAHGKVVIAPSEQKLVERWEHKEREIGDLASKLAHETAQAEHWQRVAQRLTRALGGLIGRTAAQTYAQAAELAARRVGAESFE